MFALGVALRDGAIVAVAASVVVMGALRMNPRLFMRHFPDALKQRLPPLAPEELRAGRLIGAALMILLLGGPVVSTWLWAVGTARPQPLTALFSHAFVVGMVFNLVDWLILDELWIGVLRPRWAIPPGAAIEDFTPFDHARHFRGFMTGAVLCAAVAALATAVVGVLG